ncbi:sugar phosphate isomerase/epimerase family protein [Silvibacterium acidisoli]|uniref:sugar phosphate isomerase/epimerase family protein n=1 Tax=Acidobacteriaceae bacterium ZG23-2 TaxID=2883246 RepID=UPI00406C1463
MQRRTFVKSAVGASLYAGSSLLGFAGSPEKATPYPPLKPMAIGLLIKPSEGPEEKISQVSKLGLDNCFLSLDDYIGKFTPQLAQELRGLLDKYKVVPTTAEVVGPGPLKWNFQEGPSTIGVVPQATRAARIDALRQVSDFAKLLGIRQIQTHCGFIPENPREPLYEEAVAAIRQVADHCAGNDQHFLMETGQETPITMLRALRDVNRPNLGVGLDTANLILYGKASPVEAAEILGKHVRSIHAKDGKWPTNPDELGEEVRIGEGIVDFAKVFTLLKQVGYTGAVTIEREISGAQQIEDVRKEKVYLENVLAKISA